ncbi:lecithin retinol acyltransferase family protein [Leptospira noguchii]|uniref:Phosphatidylcholine--retinol O-acyltransferase domain protein n=1 Tax=Leptospira noguchii TaxID=28182 RepID=M6VJF1_9LEPT|nr:lecithin retinol acyltransferase family protein [Leptospira noguchii]EMO55161.1 phosphatidylcholine--retinol O-acyltransferase domain protein [Leptospira noguchii]
MSYINGINLHRLQHSGFIASRTKDGLFAHTAIIIGRDSQGIVWLIENNYHSGVQWTSLETFALGEHISITRPNLNPNLTVQRAISQLGKSYSLFAYNCQHFTSWAANGKAFSPDLMNWMFVGFIITTGLVAFNSKKL